jgi:hypothetical protein
MTMTVAAVVALRKPLKAPNLTNATSIEAAMKVGEGLSLATDRAEIDSGAAHRKKNQKKKKKKKKKSWSFAPPRASVSRTLLVQTPTPSISSGLSPAMTPCAEAAPAAAPTRRAPDIMGVIILCTKCF